MDQSWSVRTWIINCVFILITVNCIQGIPITQKPHNDSQPSTNTEVDKPTEVANADDVLTPEFVRKVFSAFFEELKNRPDVVDEILKQEAYRMLENWAAEEGEPPLSSELGDLPNMNPNQPIPVYYGDVQPISSLGSQGNLQQEKRKSDTIDTKSKTSANEGSKVEPNIQSNDGNLKMELLPGSIANGDSLGNTVMNTEPYYYYLYYDDNENQTPNMQAIGKQNQLQGNEQNEINKEIEDNKNKEKIDESQLRQIDETSKENNVMSDSIEPEDAKMERIVTAVKGQSSGKGSSTSGQNKNISVVNSKAFSKNERPSDEEAELANLAT